jgi:hypothetical protein
VVNARVREFFGLPAVVGQAFLPVHGSGHAK